MIWLAVALLLALGAVLLRRLRVPERDRTSRSEASVMASPEHAPSRVEEPPPSPVDKSVSDQIDSHLAPETLVQPEPVKTLRPEELPASVPREEEQHPKGPSWMDLGDWETRVSAYRRQGRRDSEIAQIAAHLEKRGPRRPRSREAGIARSLETGSVNRAVYVPKEDEAPHLIRDEAGELLVRLVDSGDRLSIWSPVDGGALLNPKGPGLRKLGLLHSGVRGAQHYRGRRVRGKGAWVELRREPDNPHDKNAVAMYAPGARSKFGYVQKGRAATLAKRMASGADMAGVSLNAEGSWILIGSRSDLELMLKV